MEQCHIFIFPCMCFKFILLDIFCWHKQPSSAVCSLVFSLTSKIHWGLCWRLFFNAENNNKQFHVYRRPSAYTVFTAILSLFLFLFVSLKSQLFLLKTCMHLDGKRLIHPCVHVHIYTHICIYIQLKLLPSRNRYILYIIIYLCSN